MKNCKACEKVAELDKHFDAIFNYMDEYDIDYGELPFIRMDLHHHAKELEDEPRN